MPEGGRRRDGRKLGIGQSRKELNVTTQELMDLLKVKPTSKPAAWSASSTPVLAPSGAGRLRDANLSLTQTDGAAGPFSATALILDEWDLAQGERLSEVQSQQISGPKDRETWADLFASCFLPEPQLTERCE